MPEAERSLLPIVFRPIGVIHTPHTDPGETPIQPAYAEGVTGRAEILAEFAEGLRDLEGFSHLHLIYGLHRAGPARLMVRPFLHDTPRGVFATRAPSRPNPIGLSIVRLVRREGRVLHLADLDMLDGTPLLDIKPYVARFDCRRDARGGWHREVDEETARRLGSRERPADSR